LPTFSKVYSWVVLSFWNRLPKSYSVCANLMRGASAGMVFGSTGGGATEGGAEVGASGTGSVVAFCTGASTTGAAGRAGDLVGAVTSTWVGDGAGVGTTAWGAAGGITAMRASGSTRAGEGIGLGAALRA
jgi:hypothetical protein